MNQVRYFSKLLLFWLGFFLVNRLFFTIYYQSELSTIAGKELLRVLPNTLPLDLSFIAYLSAIFVLLLFIHSICNHKTISRIVSNVILALNYFFILITSIIIGSEISLYDEWSTKLNYTAISHLKNPSEVFLTASFSNYITLAIALTLGTLFVVIYKKCVHQHFENYKTGILFSTIKLPIVLGLLLLVIRGGWGDVPLNTSNAYFSKHIILNDLAVNPNWNLIQSVLKSKNDFTGNPYKKHTDIECDNFKAEFSEHKNEFTEPILNTTQPNIVFIILEGWSADNIETLEGLEGITPHFKALEKEGLLFTNFYTNGWTSDQGISSIFSSFPVFPYVAIINQIDKSRKLPSLRKSLKNYHASFFYGGQLTFGNIKGYLLSQKFDVVKDHNDYKNLPAGRLGVHDEYMFTQFKDELSKLSEPFMSALFTVSSHSPYDFPGEHKLSFNSKSDPYVNSVAYSDRCLGDFMEQVKSESWYENTLFVLVADHSHRSPREWRVSQKERFQIPMLWYGEVLKEGYIGSTHQQMGSHVDISATVLNQLNLGHSEFQWSRNLLNPSIKPAIPFAFHRGYGLMNRKGYYAFSEDYQKVFEHYYEDSIVGPQIKKDAELYFQSAFQNYLDL
ncbi:LTA synthase family protein [Flavobacteriales bacterium]|nr:LTA synthase family protein [Flavobacteriales bacterium]